MSWEVEEGDKDELLSESEDSEEKDTAEQYTKFTDRQRWLVLLLAGLCSFLSPLSMCFFMPAQAIIQAGYAASALEAVVCIQIFGVFTGIIPFLIAPISDRMGRKTVLLICLPVFLVAQFLSPWSPQIWVLIIGRAVAGAGIAPAVAVGTGAIYDIFPPSDRTKALGLLMVPSTIGPLIGPTLGGLVAQTLGWHWTIWIPALMATPVVVLVLFFFPETLDKRPWMVSRLRLPSWNPLKPIGRYLFSHPIFWYTTARAMSMSAILTTVPMSNWVLSNYPNSFSPLLLGVTTIPFSLGAVLGAGAGGGLPDYFLRKLGVPAARIIPGVVCDALTSVGLMVWANLIYVNAWAAVGFTAVLGALSFTARTSYFSTICAIEPSRASTLSSLIQLWTFLAVGIWSLVAPLLVDATHTIALVFTIFALLIDTALIPVVIYAVYQIRNPPPSAFLGLIQENQPFDDPDSHPSSSSSALLSSSPSSLSSTSTSTSSSLSATTPSTYSTSSTYSHRSSNPIILQQENRLDISSPPQSFLSRT